MNNCSECNGEMKKMKTINSGNSIFVEYQCTNCFNKKTVCEGIRN